MGHEIVARAGDSWSTDATSNMTRSATPACAARCPRQLDRAGVDVEAEELRRRIRLGHQDGRRAEAATHVGHLGAALRAWPRRLPRPGSSCDQVGGVARTEEARRALEQARGVLAPRHALAGAEVVRDALLGLGAGLDDVKGTGHEGRAIIVGQRGRLFGRQGETVAGGIVRRRTRRLPGRTATRARTSRWFQSCRPARRSRAAAEMGIRFSQAAKRPYRLAPRARGERPPTSASAGEGPEVRATATAPHRPRFARPVE